MAWTTDLIMTSSPQQDNIFSSHACTFFQIPSFMYLKVPFFDLPTSEGIQRYLSLKDSLVTLSDTFTSCLTALEHPLLKKTEDFSRLTFWPEALQ